ncbi:hypothetical protein C5N14_05625 [Micromonospora sp. MW-13]|uniref:hypothetical protein n=1 Tax=unclassified Micromonospora TaxID=2617518 RepID=UPI000ED9E356|nr:MULTISPECIES: hypothetical protein [unclassified Micromonospora]MCX4474017.1 hypothetical protein [Micromonospora sp. NBC_01655]RGC69888.1 hypothetical protein C5N14_05625 [Micromonospora sp. MW-13]
MPASLHPVPTPSPDQVRKHLACWREGDSEKIDAALRVTFGAIPQNTDVGAAGVKVAALNSLYATGILGVLKVARHIVSLDIDAALAEPDVNPDLIEKIAIVDFGGNKRRNYSFATKYCSFHRPDLYPIYDSLVAGVLNELLKQGATFDNFAPGERWAADYAIWHRSINRFRTHYSLEEFSIREIDKYLWMLGKERKEGHARRPAFRTRRPRGRLTRACSEGTNWAPQSGWPAG